MDEVLIYGNAILFFISIFPIYIYNYAYINTEEKFASINVAAFRYVRLYNVNTIKDKPNKIQINGKDKGIDFNTIKLNFEILIKKLCVYKFIQLTDYGLKNEANSYVSIVHHVFTYNVYALLGQNRSFAKLKSYTLLNEKHSNVTYYAKTVTIINLMVVSKIIFLIIMEKINAFKNKKKQRQGI